MIINRPFVMMRRILLLLIPPLFFACTSLSPISPTGRETRPKKVSEIEAELPRWQLLEADSYPRVDYFAGRIKNPRLDYWALRVDLQDPRLRVAVNTENTSTYVSSFTRNYNCFAGINTNPFSPVSGKEGEERTTIGIAIANGIIIAPPHPTYDALVFYNGARSKGAIVHQKDITDLSLIEHAVGGFYMVLEQGSLSQRLLGESGHVKQDLPRHPRSAAGLSEDGSILYLLVVDGRRPGSIGATEAELGFLLRQLGAYNGLNFDGGGSTSLALRFPDGKVRVVNTPIHSQIPGKERGVATCLGLKL